MPSPKNDETRRRVASTNWSGMTRSSGRIASFLLPTGQRGGGLEAPLDVGAREAREPPGPALPRREHQHLLDAPDEPATEVEALPARELAQRTGPVSDRPRVHGGGEAGGLGPLPRRVREHVEGGGRQLRGDRDGLVPGPLPLARAYPHHVRAETEVRGRRREAIDDPRSEEHTSEL